MRDTDDECKTQPGPKSTRGCPDQDNDGVRDTDDECKTQPGPKSTNGCPDSDNDDIRDTEDACPNQKGPKSAKGCPDADGDSIPDRIDDCPDEKGTANFDGCPDTDGDGIRDKDDDCPKEHGIASFKGCPDSDGDGIPNKADNCPYDEGIWRLDGCPWTLFKDPDIGIGFSSSVTWSWLLSDDDLLKGSGTNWGARVGLDLMWFPGGGDLGLLAGIGYSSNYGGNLNNHYPKVALLPNSKVNNPRLDTLPAGANFKYHLSYFDIPFGLRIGRLEHNYEDPSFYAEALFSAGFLSGAQTDISGAAVEKDGIDIKNDVQGTALSLGLGVGFSITSNIEVGLRAQWQLNELTLNQGKVALVEGLDFYPSPGRFLNRVYRWEKDVSSISFGTAALRLVFWMGK
ncbi:MAG: thrombospondin type 3 repeat-containing protein [Saprospiraceae bacterium]